MTLIAAGIHRHQAYIATDSRVTYIDTGEVYSEETSKSMMIDAGDGKVLIGYTGTASLEGIDTILWITDTLSRLGVKNKSIDEIFEHLSVELGYIFGNMAGGALGNPAPVLVIIVAGWKSGIGRHPKLLELSNLEGYNEKNPLTTFTFKQRILPISPNGTGLHIDGDMRATHSSEFRRQCKTIQKLLNHNSNKLDSYTEQEMARLIKIAAEDLRSSTINDRVATGRIGRKSDGLRTNFYPSDMVVKNYPGYVDKNIAISGVRIVNDFIEGGTTIIGGPGKDLPPFMRK